MYLKGEGVLQDYKEALRWLRLAAEQGNGIAQLNLGAMYADGEGVSQDFALAHMWANVAASLLSDAARERAIKNRDRDEAEMTSAQVNRAQQMAKSCLASHSSSASRLGSDRGLSRTARGVSGSIGRNTSY